MSLWFFLNVNDDRIGMCEVRRQEYLDLTDPAAIADAVSTYTVRIDDLPPVEVRHRYGDGPWALLVAALTAALPAEQERRSASTIPALRPAPRRTEHGRPTATMRRALRLAVATGSIHLHGTRPTIEGLVARGLAFGPHYGLGRECYASVTDAGIEIGRAVLAAEQARRATT